MSNSFVNLEFGFSNDSKIAVTPYGMAVKSASGDWNVLDRKSKTLRSVANQEINNGHVLLLPAKTLKVRDLIKMDEKYFFVLKPVGEDNIITLLDAEDGKVVRRVPNFNHFLGMEFYTKVMVDDRHVFEMMFLYENGRLLETLQDKTDQIPACEG
jgi:hypothetical protein